VTAPEPSPLAGIPARLRAHPGALLAGMLVAGVVFAFPSLMDAAVPRLGVRAVAAALLALTLASAAFAGRGAGATPGIDGFSKAALAAVLGFAAVAGSATALRLVIVVVYLALASLFFRSLRGGGSLIESGLRRLEPATPDFVAPYCRKITALWGGFFLVNGAILGVLAFTSPDERWAFYSGRMLHAQMAIFFVVEFVVRKTWFRYYLGSGPIDRLWSWLFPAENTEAGRRSAAYIRRTNGTGPP
jgi:uncharacterized membrane protein